MRRASEAIREPSSAYRGCFRSGAWGWSAARGAHTVCSAWICRLCRGDDPARRTHHNTGWTWNQEMWAIVALRFEGRYLGFRIMQMGMLKNKSWWREKRSGHTWDGESHGILGKAGRGGGIHSGRWWCWSEPRSTTCRWWRRGSPGSWARSPRAAGWRAAAE